jgi:hypothetical protein
MKKLSIFLMIFLFSIAIFAQEAGEEGIGVPGHHRIHKRGGKRFAKANFWFNERIMEEAKIPKNLRAKIRLTMHDARKKMFDLGFKIREINIKMNDEYFKESINWKKLRNLNESEFSARDYCYLGVARKVGSMQMFLKTTD